MAHPINILERYWKFTKFKPNQEAIINAVIEGEDTLPYFQQVVGNRYAFKFRL